MPARTLALLSVVAVAVQACALGQAGAAAGASPTALRAVVERGYSQLNRDTSKLAAVMARPIVAGSAAQASAVSAVMRMRMDLERMGSAVQIAAGGSPAAATVELKAITQFKTALATFQASLSARTDAEAIRLAGSMQTQLATANATVKRAARLLGCPNTC